MQEPRHDDTPDEAPTLDIDAMCAAYREAFPGATPEAIEAQAQKLEADEMQALMMRLGADSHTKAATSALEAHDPGTAQVFRIESDAPAPAQFAGWALDPVDLWKILPAPSARPEDRYLVDLVIPRDDAGSAFASWSLRPVAGIDLGLILACRLELTANQVPTGEVLRICPNACTTVGCACANQPRYERIRIVVRSVVTDG